MKVTLVKTYEDKAKEISKGYIQKAHDLEIKQKDIAEVLHVTAGSISRQFKKKRLSIDVMAAIEMLAEERRELEEV